MPAHVTSFRTRAYSSPVEDITLSEEEIAPALFNYMKVVTPDNGVWFALKPAANQLRVRTRCFPIITPYVRITGRQLPILLVKKYIATKLNLGNETDVELNCRGPRRRRKLSHVCSPFLCMMAQEQHIQRVADRPDKQPEPSKQQSSTSQAATAEQAAIQLHPTTQRCSNKQLQEAAIELGPTPSSKQRSNLVQLHLATQIQLHPAMQQCSHEQVAPAAATADSAPPVSSAGATV
ncbi:hypothetical protein SELMODRAFT_427264 [Selaginella moellendorffii]|uniref:Uncharacterized protein n=1 Tax=Selaginella moellendorffii TaxID=88036 RepID=D8SZ18_SELML|nr:hypothetical protein SELMODRAFT_427264 [Selaginella moellendorffii]